jgi:hypothetical protein
VEVVRGDMLQVKEMLEEDLVEIRLKHRFGPLSAKLLSSVRDLRRKLEALLEGFK